MFSCTCQKSVENFVHQIKKEPSIHMSNTLWVLKDPILLASSFTLEDVLKGNITMECVMAQLRAMSTHFVKDWIMSVLMI